MTGIFRFSAHSFTGGAASSNPRPFFLSGAVTIRAGTSPAFSSSSRKTLASRGVPKKTNRTLLLIAFIFLIHGGRFVSARHGAPKPSYRKTPLVLFFFCAGYFCHLRIYIHLVGERCRDISL